MSSAPKGALAATSISQEVQPTIRTHGAEAQHATSTYGAARDAICSLLGLHPEFQPGPPLGAPEASTTDMATGSPSQCTSFLFVSISLVILYLGNVGFVSLDKDLL
ncbi:hypothetical protein V6N13_102064 [Hibiscus sabdariffa]